MQRQADQVCCSPLPPLFVYCLSRCLHTLVFSARSNPHWHPRLRSAARSERWSAILTRRRVPKPLCPLLAQSLACWLRPKPPAVCCKTSWLCRIPTLRYVGLCSTPPPSSLPPPLTFPHLGRITTTSLPHRCRVGNLHFEALLSSLYQSTQPSLNARVVCASVSGMAVYHRTRETNAAKEETKRMASPPHAPSPMLIVDLIDDTQHPGAVCTPREGEGGAHNKQETGQETTQHNMHVTACLAGLEDVDVEVGESCRTLQALKEAIVKALPQLCVEGFDVSVGGRALDSDEAVVSLTESVCLDVVPNTRGLSVLALREAGREVSEGGLLRAARDGDITLCTLYLDAGVPTQCVCKNGWTPLHFAAINRHVDVMALLLDRGHDVECRSSDGQTPLHASAANGHREGIALLLERGHASECCTTKNVAPLHFAARNGHEEVVSLLLDWGHDLQCRSSDAETPLHAAAANGHSDTISLLVERGHEVESRARNGQTPLHDAAAKGHRGAISLLLDRGHGVQCCTSDDVTPLHFAARNGHHEAVALLLDRGHDLQCRTTQGTTPLHFAARHGHQETVSLLLDRGHEVGCRTTNGATPLSATRPHGYPEICGLLSSRQAAVLSS